MIVREKAMSCSHILVRYLLSAALYDGIAFDCGVLSKQSTFTEMLGV
jgi:hypothetical protein